jgi:hypothetical protein
MPGTALPLEADLDRADEVMQQGEAEYAVHKGHDCGTGIEEGLVQVPRL